MRVSLLTVVSSICIAAGQQAGTMEQEKNPTVHLTECITVDSCTHSNLKVTLDANWRWVHHVSGYENCYTGDRWSSTYCSDPEQCAQQCVLEGVTGEKYLNTYGIEQIDNGVKLNFVTDHQYGTNVGSRLYMLDESGEKYKMFHLKNREFAMTFNVANAHCGMNGAMYFVEMDVQGGRGLGHNNAGAKYGTGYCDAQCPHDIKFIDGIANSVDWKPNPKDESDNMGAGKYGSCCAEMDIWEANSMANAYTPHPCNIEGQLRCEGVSCGDNDKNERYQGVCDKDGCDINPFRMGNPAFYGRGPQFAVNTLMDVTVVTQFLTDDGTDTGDLSEIRRYYVQDGKVIHSPNSTILGPSDTDSITDDFCAAKKQLFGDVNDYHHKGGSRDMGKSLDRGHVMALSLWDDVEVNMLWLDSAFPLDKPATDPGVKRGECPGGASSTPSYVRETYPDGWVSFQNAFIGPIGSFGNHPTPPPPTPAPCVPGCVAAPGQNQPECNGRSKISCENAMNHEGKCSWNDCPDVPEPTPTPAPMPTPSPEPECRMESAELPDGYRCRGRPIGGWGALGRKISANQCQEACLAREDCQFAHYKRQKCSYYRECEPPFQNQGGFEIWEKHCDTAVPSPPPSRPNPDCLPLCNRVDLSAGGESCDYLSKFPRLCENTFVKTEARIKSCQVQGSDCKASLHALDCPKFDEQCSDVSLLEVGMHKGREEKVKEPVHRGSGFLARWRSNVGGSLVQQVALREVVKGIDEL